MDLRSLIVWRTFPEQGSNLPDVQTLKRHFGIDDVRGSLGFSDSFDIATIRQLVNEVQYEGSLEATASDFTTGKFSFRVSNQRLIARLSIEPLHTQYSDFNYQFLDCCHNWLARFLEEFNLGAFRSLPERKDAFSNQGH